MKKKRKNKKKKKRYNTSDDKFDQEICLWLISCESPLEEEGLSLNSPVAPPYSLLAPRSWLDNVALFILVMLDLYEPLSWSELPLLNSELCPGFTPSFKSSNDTSPSNARTICLHAFY